MSVETRWSEALEARRQGYLAAGLQPTLFPYWRGTATGELLATLVFLSGSESGEDQGLAADLEAEIAYRSDVAP